MRQLFVRKNDIANNTYPTTDMFISASLFSAEYVLIGHKDNRRLFYKDIYHRI